MSLEQRDHAWIVETTLDDVHVVVSRVQAGGGLGFNLIAVRPLIPPVAGTGQPR
jgi:hypothetical protein